MDKTTIILIGIGVFVLILCFLLAIASFSGDRFFEAYKKMLNVNTNTAFTVSAFINILNTKHFNQKVQIVPINNIGGDFYDSKKKVVGLNMSSQTSLATFSVIAHELGHAYQDIVDGELGKMHKLRRAGAFVGKLLLPIIIVTIIALFFVENYVLLLIGSAVAIFFIILLAVIIKAKTITIEKDASEKGIKMLSEFLPEDEVKKCKKLLDSARLTYWGDLIKLLLGWSGLTSKTKMFK